MPCILAAVLLLAALFPSPSFAFASEHASDIAKLQEMYAKDPSDVDAAYRLGNMLAWDKRYDEAIKIYEDVLKKAPDYVEAEIGIARSLAWRGDHDEAFRRYQAVAAAHPDEYEAWQGLGSLSLWRNDFEESIGYFGRALELESGDIVSLEGIARAYVGAGDREKAEEYFAKAERAKLFKARLPTLLLRTGFAAFVITMLAYAFFHGRRYMRKRIMQSELEVLKYAVAFHQQTTGRFPISLERLLKEKWMPPGEVAERAYLKDARLGDRGFVVDPFGERYVYDPATGSVHGSGSRRVAEAENADIMKTAGRFFVLGFDGLHVPARIIKIAEERSLGGVILYGRNISDPKQLKSLTGELARLAADIPLIVSIDQEGGEFQRMKPPHFTAYPPACSVTAKNAFKLAAEMGRELREHGINLDLAPVLDVNTNSKNPIIGKRSFSHDPESVAIIGKLFIEGLHKGGVLACGKHFPGHGDTDLDSHVALPMVSHAGERIRSVELHPFIETMKAGLKCIMTAHVVYSAIDAENPATFSSKILTELLRKELKYEGLVITDDMGMAGSMQKSDLPEVCVRAFAAGCDLILISEHHDRQLEAIEALGRAIEKSDALRRRAMESMGRIRRALA